MVNHVDELRERIASADLSDPFVQADVQRWQVELTGLLEQRADNLQAKGLKSDSEMLAWAQRQWVPALHACERELRFWISIRNTRGPRRVTTPREAAQAIRLFEGLTARMKIVLDAKSIPAFLEAQRQVVEYRNGHAALKEVNLPYPLPKPQLSGAAPKEPARGGGLDNQVARRSSPGRPQSTGGRAQGDGFASYNRLADLGRGRSFEESVAIRQSSKRERRAHVDRIDRISASGSREEYEDLDS